MQPIDRSNKTSVTLMAKLFTCSIDLLGIILFACLTAIAYAEGGGMPKYAFALFDLIPVWCFGILIAFWAAQMVLHGKLSREKPGEPLFLLAAIAVVGVDFLGYILFLGLTTIKNQLNGDVGISVFLCLAILFFFAMQISVLIALKRKAQTRREAETRQTLPS